MGTGCDRGRQARRGVRLAEVLERARIHPRALDLMPQGLDPDYVTGGVDYGRVRRPLPVAKAFKDAILAYEMNGKPLPPTTAHPVRLVVPGWVSVANIKWVGEIQVSRASRCTPTGTSTTFTPRGAELLDPDPLSRQVVKAHSTSRSTRAPASPQVLRGRSWSGLAPIRRVDISTDGGLSWHPARLRTPDLPHAWVRWEYPWTPRRTGAYTLQARATDWAGQTQPVSVPFNTLGYLFWATVKAPGHRRRLTTRIGL